MSGLNENAALRFTRPLHVLEVLGNAIVGGMEMWVERFVERLPRDRFRVTVLCPFESPITDRLRARGLQVHVLPMPEEMAWSSVNQTRELVEKLGVDILHAHLPNAHLLAGLAGRLSGRPVLTTIHGRDISPLDLEVHRAVASHFSMVCWHSYALATGLGLERRHVSCEPNGVDTDVFQPMDRRGTLHRDLGLPPDAPLVGFVGRLSPEKGPEVCVQAAQVLHATHPDAHVVFVGEGPCRHGLGELVEAAGLEGVVHFAGVRADMAQTCNEFDVVVSTSHTEALPLALLEAMACAVPVVATRVGGVSDLVVQGQTGWLVEAGDFEGISRHVGQLLDDREARVNMGERARSRVLVCWKLDDSVARIAQLLKRLALPRSAAAVAGAEPGGTVRFSNALEIFSK